MRSLRPPTGSRLLASLVLMMAALQPAVAIDTIPLVLDHSAVIKTDKSFSTIVVGNPVVAGIQQFNASTLLLTGRRFGETNVLFLDHDGTVVDEKKIAVGMPEDDQVTVYRGGDADRAFTLRVFDCSGRCIEATVPGTQNYGKLQGEYSGWDDYNAQQASKPSDGVPPPAAPAAMPMMMMPIAGGQAGGPAGGSVMTAPTGPQGK